MESGILPKSTSKSQNTVHIPEDIPEDPEDDKESDEDIERRGLRQ